MYVCITDSHFCTTETSTFYINYTAIELFKKNNIKSLVNMADDRKCDESQK